MVKLVCSIELYKHLLMCRFESIKNYKICSIKMFMQVVMVDHKTNTVFLDHYTPVVGKYVMIVKFF